MIRLINIGILIFSSMLILSACNMNSPTIATPTVESELIETPTELPTATPTLTPVPASDTPSVPTETNMPTDQPLIETPTPTNTAEPPTQKPTSTPTLGPVEYVIQTDDTLMYIIQLPQHGYDYELNVAQEVVDLNENMSSIDFLPPVGSTILIPLPTSTATPVNLEVTEQALATLGVDGSSGAQLPTGSSVGCYEVQEDDSLVSIASDYNTTLEILSQLNPDLNWFGCDFQQPSGGPDCNPTIQIAQCINVPQPTPIPTFTLTPSGNETATPTPTYPAPRMLYPVNNVVVPPGRFDLQWVGVAGLTRDDEYLVEITDMTSGQKLLQVTESTSFTVGDAFIPSDGQPHTVQWRVSVARKNESGVYGYVGGTGEWRVFEWMSQ
jgi:hypothetical protein